MKRFRSHALSQVSDPLSTSIPERSLHVYYYHSSYSLKLIRNQSTSIFCQCNLQRLVETQDKARRVILNS